MPTPRIDAFTFIDATIAQPRHLTVAPGPRHRTLVRRLCDEAEARRAQPIGADVADAMISRARAAHPDLAFGQAEAHRLPFPDASFDVVTANSAILHLSDPERAVSGFARALTPGGRVAITVWDLPERCRLFGWVLAALDTAGAQPPPDIPAGPPFFRFADDDELVGLLGTNGLGNVTTEPSPPPIGLPPPTRSGVASWTARFAPQRSSGDSCRTSSNESAGPSTPWRRPPRPHMGSRSPSASGSLSPADDLPGVRPDEAAAPIGPGSDVPAWQN
ncbi:hypothetical protein BH20ACT3_BH20ACT3_11240 [soil metagenome]